MRTQKSVGWLVSLFVASIGCVTVIGAPASAVTADYIGSDSNLYFTNDVRIFQFNRTTATLNAFNAVPAAGQQYSLRELAFDNENNLYVACHGGGSAAIVKFDRDGTASSNFLPKTEAEEYWGLTFGSDGYLYTTETNNDVIKKIDLNGSVAFSLSDGRLDEPRGLAFDTKGNLLVANAHGRNVLLYDASFGYLGEIPFTSEVWGIAVRSDGSIYVAGGNQGNFINVYNADYQFVKTLTHLDLTEPAQLAFDERDYLYASSTNRPKVVVFDDSDDHLQSFGGLFFASLGIAFDRDTADSFVPPPFVPEPESATIWILTMMAALSVRWRSIPYATKRQNDSNVQRPGL